MAQFTSNKVALEASKQVVKKAQKKMATATTAKKLLKKIPIAGVVVSGLFAGERFLKGEIVKGGLEIVSGIAGIFPGIGTVASYVIDGGLIFMDVTMVNV